MVELLLLLVSLVDCWRGKLVQDIHVCVVLLVREVEEFLKNWHKADLRLLKHVVSKIVLQVH